MLSKTVWGIAAGAASLAFVSYCIYFDRKRRSDPLFKQKLREKRRKARQSKGPSNSNVQIPDFRDAEAMQKFFLQEIQLGEELLATGELDAGMEHLSNAVAVCGRPDQLLQVLQQTLPPQLFQLLLQRLPAASQRIVSGGRGSEGLMQDEELE